MSETTNPATPTIADTPAAVVNDCWNRIGVWGDHSCKELPGVVHCRNCPVYATSARELLNVEPPQDYLGSETERFSQDKRLSQPDMRPHVMFRLGTLWFALPAEAVVEVAEKRFIHSLPHPRSPALLGLANIRGSLVTCLSLARVLQLDAAGTPQTTARRTHPRLLVVNADGGTLAWPADEVQGMHFFRPNDVKTTDAAGALAPELFRGTVAWRGVAAPCLDSAALFTLLNRHLA